MLHEYASARASCDRPVLPSMQPLRAAPGAGTRVLPRIRDCHLGAEKQHRQRLYTGSQFRDAWVLALRFRFDAPTGSGAEKIASSSCAPRRTAKNRAKDKGTSVSVPLVRASREPTAYLQRASLPATGESDISVSRRDGARTCVSTQKKYHTAVSCSPDRPTISTTGHSAAVEVRTKVSQPTNTNMYLHCRKRPYVSAVPVRRCGRDNLPRCGRTRCCQPEREHQHNGQHLARGLGQLTACRTG